MAQPNDKFFADECLESKARIEGEWLARYPDPMERIIASQSQITELGQRVQKFLKQLDSLKQEGKASSQHAQDVFSDLLQCKSDLVVFKHLMGKWVEAMKMTKPMSVNAEASSSSSGEGSSSAKTDFAGFKAKTPRMPYVFGAPNGGAKDDEPMDAFRREWLLAQPQTSKYPNHECSRTGSGSMKAYQEEKRRIVKERAEEAEKRRTMKEKTEQEEKRRAAKIAKERTAQEIGKVEKHYQQKYLHNTHRDREILKAFGHQNPEMLSYEDIGKMVNTIKEKTNMKTMEVQALGEQLIAERDLKNRKRLIKEWEELLETVHADKMVPLLDNLGDTIMKTERMKQEMESLKLAERLDEATKYRKLALAASEKSKKCEDLLKALMSEAEELDDIMKQMRACSVTIEPPRHYMPCNVRCTGAISLHPSMKKTGEFVTKGPMGQPELWTAINGGYFPTNDYYRPSYYLPRDKYQQAKASCAGPVEAPIFKGPLYKAPVAEVPLVKSQELVKKPLVNAPAVPSSDIPKIQVDPIAADVGDKLSLKKLCMEEVRKNQDKNQGNNQGNNQGKKDAWKDMFRDSTMIHAANLIKHSKALLAYKASAKLTDAELRSIKEDLARIKKNVFYKVKLRFQESGDYERVAAAVDNMVAHYKKLKNMKK
ncbi:hypothetical protein B9Z55_028612 [Caenorhabditis nigoni]|uniref:Uncharacterized protein n=1 Tax=Caenorhabditis nigoni TaxID=1611254 RepID=A0A2G5SAN2_9PELO|nr:hypothetical protein B9Z55_028612 [Caenorhabditis nigoni]